MKYFECNIFFFILVTIVYQNSVVPAIPAVPVMPNFEKSPRHNAGGVEIVCGMLYVVCCMYVECCMLYGVWCMVYVYGVCVWCMVYVYGVYFVLHIVCGMLYVDACVYNIMFHHM